MAFSVRLDTPARVSADLSASGRTLLTEWFLGLKGPPATIDIGFADEELADADSLGDVLIGISDAVSQEVKIQAPSDDEYISSYLLLLN